MRQILFAIAILLSAPAFSAPPVRSMETREQWHQSLPLLRMAMEVEIQQAGKPAHTLWLIWERTPHGRQQIAIQDGSLPADQAQEKQTVFLVQDKYAVAIQGEEVSPTAAPWMLGVNLFGQSLEPEMLLSWSLGMPGQDFALGALPAQVALNDDRLVRIEQAGWRVDYEAWSLPTPAHPSLPSRLRLSRGDTVLEVRVDTWEPHLQLPADYQEFAIQ